MSKRRPNHSSQSTISSRLPSEVNVHEQNRQYVSDQPLIIRNMDAKQKSVIRSLFFVFIFCFWSLRYYNFLFVAQEYDLFAWQTSYLIDASTRIAGLSRYLSSFFIQFFYYPVLGALILSTFASLAQFLTEKVFRLEGLGFVFSFVPAIIPILEITNISYFIFERVDIAYIFSFTFNFCFSLALAYIFSHIVSPTGRIIFLIITLLTTYPIFGFFTLLGGYLCIFHEAFIESKKENATNSSNGTEKKPKTEKQYLRERCELLALFVLTTPALFWFAYSHTTPSFYYCYFAGLWEESTLTLGREPVASNFFLPFLLLFQGKGFSRDTTTNSILYFLIVVEILFLVITPLIKLVLMKRTAHNRTNTSFITVKGISLYNALTIAGFVLITVSVYAFSYSSANYQTLLRIARYLDNEDWNELLKDEAKISDPINPLISARITALIRTGRLAEEAFQRPLVPKDSYALRSVTTFSMCGDRMLYHSGCINLAERTAINDFVTKRDRSTWALKTLVLCAIASERPELAQRYLHLMQKTLFQRQFAKELATYLNWRYNSNKIYNNYLANTQVPQERLERWDAHFAAIRKLQPSQDDLASSGAVDHVRYRVAQEEDLSKRDIEECENILATILISRNFQRFGKAFDEYLAKKGDRPLPRSLAEAVLIRRRFPQFFSQEQTRMWNPPVNAKPTQEMERRFQDFSSKLSLNESDEAINAKLSPLYGDTFWFFFGAATNIHNY